MKYFKASAFLFTGFGLIFLAMTFLNGSSGVVKIVKRHKLSEQESNILAELEWYGNYFNPSDAQSRIKNLRADTRKNNTVFCALSALKDVSTRLKNNGLQYPTELSIIATIAAECDSGANLDVIYKFRKYGRRSTNILYALWDIPDLLYYPQLWDAIKTRPSENLLHYFDVDIKSFALFLMEKFEVEELSEDLLQRLSTLANQNFIPEQLLEKIYAILVKRYLRKKQWYQQCINPHRNFNFAPTKKAEAKVLKQIIKPTMAQYESDADFVQTVLRNKRCNGRALFKTKPESFCDVNLKIK